MNHTLRPKSILKYRPELPITSISTTNNNNASPVTAASSWFSRIQSKLYVGTRSNSNDLDNEEYKRSLTLPKQDLRRVTFSVGNLTTEHPFCSDDSPRDEQYEQEKIADSKNNCSTSRNLQDIKVMDLANHYEHACILREEGIIDRFRNILKTSRKAQLHSVDLSQQPITPNQAGPLSDVFILNFGLSQLNLSNCKLNDEIIRIILCSLLSSNTVQSLNLSQNNFKFKGYKYIAIFMKESKSIQCLNISQNTIERRGIEYLAQGIKLASTLKKLIFDKCIIKPIPSSHMSPTLIEIFANGITQSSTSLKSMSICSNAMFATIHPSTNTSWMNSLLSHSGGEGGLVDLDLSGNNLEPWMPALAVALRNNQSITRLVLSNCKISPEGLSILSDALAGNTCLESLDLSMNFLSYETDEGILALKTALGRNSTLTSLNLSNTQMDSSTAIALAEALPENTSLSRLDLSKNPMIEMAGILALSISIKMNHTLTFLDINIPPLDEELANLQNDIVAVCTTNMLQKVEAQKKLDEVVAAAVVAQQQEMDEAEITTLSPSSSSSSSNSSTLDTAVVELPSTDVLINGRKGLDGSTSPQLTLGDGVTTTTTTTPSSNNTLPDTSQSTA